MAVLFDKEESNIRRHITNVFKEGELDRENNVHFLHVNGVKKPVPYYTLDVIISVGYRVHSQRGVRFRQWANRVLKQFLIKGYAVNERIRKQQISELRQLVQVLGRTLQQQHPCCPYADNAIRVSARPNRKIQKIPRNLCGCVGFLFISIDYITSPPRKALISKQIHLRLHVANVMQILK